jgi:hypothetical protein
MKKIKRYLLNFGSNYAEYRKVPETTKCGMDMFREMVELEEIAYKGVKYKNKCLFFIEYWLGTSLMFSPFWLGYLLRDYIYPVLMWSFKMLLTVLLWKFVK